MDTNWVADLLVKGGPFWRRSEAGGTLDHVLFHQVLFCRDDLSPMSWLFNYIIRSWRTVIGFLVCISTLHGVGSYGYAGSGYMIERRFVCYAAFRDIHQLVSIRILKFHADYAVLRCGVLR
jgi:hypothetical protein